MSSNIVLGRYYPLKSHIHSLNAISKIICILLFTLTTLINNSLLYGIFSLVISSVVIYLTDVPIKLYLKSISKMKVFLIFIFLINLLFRIDLASNLLMIIKIVLVISYSSVLMMTTKPSEITKGLEKILKPLNKLNINTTKISLSISLALSFTPTIFDQANKILKSQASRGADYRSFDLKNKIIAIKSIIFPMINLSLKKADTLADAMEVRLFSFSGEKTNYHTTKWTDFDSIAVLIHVILMIGVFL